MKSGGEMLIAGNWKMYRTRAEGVALADELRQGVDALPPAVRLAIFPPFTALAAVAERCRGTRIEVGAQNVHPAAEGAFTGEISPPMLLEAGATSVLIGHSERRAHFGERDAWLAEKVRSALDHGLAPVFCLGESLEEREAGRAEEVIGRQVRLGLGALSGEDLGRLVIAYEPVWAIGTGRTATPDQAREAHRFLRECLREAWGDSADGVPLLYGGSVKPGNAAELLAQPEVDGVLVGGASLDAASFLEIAGAAS